MLAHKLKISERKRLDDIVRHPEQEHKSRALGLVYINAEGFLCARHFAEVLY